MVKIITTRNIDFSMESQILTWKFMFITYSVINHPQKAKKIFL